jgi:hypothetical protein
VCILLSDVYSVGTASNRCRDCYARLRLMVLREANVDLLTHNLVNSLVTKNSQWKTQTFLGWLRTKIERKGFGGRILLSHLFQQYLLSVSKQLLRFQLISTENKSAATGA